MDTDVLRRQARRRRKILGWNQEEVARRADVSVGTLQNFELGKAVPQPENLASILRVLGIDQSVDGGDGGDAQAEEAPPPVSLERTWPADISVFLDMMGAYLLRFEEAERLRIIHSVTRQIFVSHQDS